MTQLIVIERKAEATVEGGCCEPDCGPEACAPATTGETGEQGVAQAGCCESDCGPETCTCG
jgi:hypothetical protein